MRETGWEAVCVGVLSFERKAGDSTGGPSIQYYCWCSVNDVAREKGNGVEWLSRSSPRFLISDERSGRTWPDPPARRRQVADCGAFILHCIERDARGPWN